MFLLDMNTRQIYRTNTAFVQFGVVFFGTPPLIANMCLKCSLSNRSFIFPPAESEDKNSQSRDYKEVVRLCVKITNIFLHMK